MRSGDDALPLEHLLSLSFRPYGLYETSKGATQEFTMRSRSIHGGRGNESRGCCFCRCPDKSFAYSPQNIHATSCHQSPYRPFMGHRSAKRITAGGLKCSTLWKYAALFSQAPWARSLAASRFNLKPDPRGYSETRAKGGRMSRSLQGHSWPGTL